MLTGYYRNDDGVNKEESTECLDRYSLDQIFWIDLMSPSDAERKKIESVFKIDFEKLKVENEMESNARFYESEDIIFISANFITLKGISYESTPVYLYLLNNVLITEREASLTSFDETIKKIKRNRKVFRNGSDVLEGILETKFDVDADFIEEIAKNIATVGKSLSLKNSIDKQSVLLKISDYQEATTLSRESFIDKQRVASALLKSNIFENKDRLKILFKDINSMLDYTSFIFFRLEYLQNTLLGLINVEQNKTIKIFTIVAVVFMPPTLIASIYGMNFKSMPELNWSYGYPMANFLIIGSSILTLLIFKRKDGYKKLMAIHIKNCKFWIYQKRRKMLSAFLI